jgi:hypothetical protein
MMEQAGLIPDDLPACQEQLRAVLERLHELQRQLDEFLATTEERERAYKAAGSVRAATPL